VLRPPWLHGRGAFDMKSYTVAQLVAVLQLAARERPPERSVILLATSGEESGSDLGVRWFVREHPDIVRRIWAVMTEGGVVEARRIDDPKYWGTDVGQKRFVELLACAPTHERLAQLAGDVAGRGGAITVDPSVQHFLELYGRTRDFPALRDLLAHPQQIARDPLAGEVLPAYLRSMLRNEVLTFGVEPSPSGGFQLRIVLALLPRADVAVAWRELLPPSLTGGVTITLRDAQTPSVVSPLDHPVMSAIASELRARYPRAIAGPFFHPLTATDARFLRPLGIPSYGFSPFLILTPDTEHMHRSNERVPVTTFVEGADLYEAVVRRVVDNSRQSP
jgi:acetylornithine deacetylase/succinyl-diaminopimelate desuccinylase-like protein